MDSTTLFGYCSSHIATCKGQRFIYRMAGFVLEHVRTFCVKQVSFSVSCAFSAAMLMSCRYRGQWSFRSTYDVRLFETDRLLYTDSVAAGHTAPMPHRHICRPCTRGIFTSRRTVAIAIHGQHRRIPVHGLWITSRRPSALCGVDLPRSLETCIPGLHLLRTRNGDRVSSALPHSRDRSRRYARKVLDGMPVFVESHVCHGSTAAQTCGPRLPVFDVDGCLYRRSSYLHNFSKPSSS